MYKLFCLLFIIVTISCQSKEHDIAQQVLDLNSKACEIINMNPDSALILLDSAIKLDSKFSTAYFNEVIIYCNKAQYTKAIECNKNGLKSKPDLAESIMFMGLLYDKTKDTIRANIEYSKAIQLFNLRLKVSNKNSKANKINRAISLILLGNEKGREDLNKLLIENPDDSILKDLQKFGKAEYIAEVLPN